MYQMEDISKLLKSKKGVVEWVDQILGHILRLGGRLRRN